ncbi:MAG: hypothetical protein AABZ11_09395, partial [Nitrospinota bacterium]
MSWKIILPSLILLQFSVQSAEAYTYQDVLNAYNNAKTQYPDDKIWIEGVTGGYRIWRRPGKIFYYSALIYETGHNVTAGIGGALILEHQCGFNDYMVGKKIPEGGQYFVGDIVNWYDFYCDGSSHYRGILYERGGDTISTLPCQLGHTSPLGNCKASDVLLGEYIPVDLCLDKIN